MARRRRHQNSYQTPRSATSYTVASVPSPTLLLRALSPVPMPITQRAYLPDDWRNWEPDPIVRRPKTFSGSTPAIKTSSKATAFGYQDHFAAPAAVVQCVRRKQRREVINALGKAGKRGKKGPYRRNLWSTVKC